MIDRAPVATAVVAATNSMWIWTIEDVSQGLSIVLTLLGILWLLIQMTAWFMKRGG